MTVQEHLSELRKALLCYCLATVFIFFIAYSNSEVILQIILFPLKKFKQILFFTSIPDGFLIYLKISCYTSLILSIPIGIYELFSFVRPALNRHENNFFLIVICSAFLLFCLGLAVAYIFIIPMAWEFFISFESGSLSYLPNANDYLSLFFSFLIAFGLCFQLPVILICLSKLGIISKQKLKDFRRYNIVLTFSVAAILTPPDITSQICLSTIILILYEVTIFFMKDNYARH